MDSESWNLAYEAESEQMVEEPDEFLLKQVGDLQPGRALDLGCGTGANVIGLAQRGWEVTGVDWAKTAIEPGQDAAALPRQELREGQILWATIDAPWLHKLDRGMFRQELNRIRQMEPKVILSSHLPTARGMTEQLLDSLVAAPEAQPFVGPDQEGLQAMIAQMTG